jgi:anaerobic sulfite reductase subunit B
MLREEQQMRNPLLPVAGSIISTIQETDVEYTLTIESSIKPQHGQFVEVSLPGCGEAPISVSGFGDGWIALTIRAVGDLTRKIVTRNVGEKLWLRGPYGTSFPEAKLRDSLVVVAAGGCALAPLRTFITARLADPATAAKTRLIFGFKNPESVLYKEEIEAWKKVCQVIVTVDNEACSWNGRTGLITRHIGDIDLPDPEKAAAVVVGPPIMMKFTTIEFTKRKVSADRIWVSFERKMACGIGKCGHCKIDNTYVCLDGPVLRYDTALNLLD